MEELHFFKLLPPVAGIGTKEWPCYDTWAFWLSLALLGWGTVWHFVAMYRVVKHVNDCHTDLPAPAPLLSDTILLLFSFNQNFLLNNV